MMHNRITVINMRSRREHRSAWALITGGIIAILLPVFLTCTVTISQAAISAPPTGSIREFAAPGATGGDGPVLQRKLTDSSNMWLLASNYGLFGNPSYEFEETDGHDGFISTGYGSYSGFDYLFLGSVWVGAVVEGDTLVSTGFDGWYQQYEMFPGTAPGDTLVEHHICPEHPQYNPDTVGDQQLTAVYTDTMLTSDYPGVSPDHINPLGIEITQEIFSWGGENHSDYAILKLTVRNIGEKLLEDAHIGLFMDADCGPAPEDWSIMRHLDDICGSRFIDSGGDDHLVAWMSDYEQSSAGDDIIAPSAYCAALIGAPVPVSRIEQNFNWWMSDPMPDFDWGPGPVLPCGSTGTPDDDVSKYWVLAGIGQEPGDPNIDDSGNDVDQLDALKQGSPVGDADTKFLLSFGSGNLPPGGEAELVFLIFAADFIDEELVIDFSEMEARFLEGAAMLESDYSLNPVPMIPRELMSSLVQDPGPAIELEWWVYGDVCNIDGFNLYRSEISGVYDKPLNEDLIPVDPEFNFERVQTYLDDGVEGGSLYYYIATSVDPEGQESSPSLEIARKAGSNLIRVPEDSLTIGAAIEGAWDGDTIRVSPGTYTGAGNLNLDFQGKTLVLESSGGAESTVLSCVPEAYGIVFMNKEPREAVVRGFTITGGASGIGIYAGSPTIEDCVISGNADFGIGRFAYSVSSPEVRGCSVTGNGGGVSCDFSAVLVDCVISDNDGKGIECGEDVLIEGCSVIGNTGGGIDCGEGVEIAGCIVSDNSSVSGPGAAAGITCGDGVIEKTVISGNHSTSGPGGVSVNQSSSVEIVNCFIHGNSSDGFAGGIACWSSSPLILNSTIAGNSGAFGGGVLAYEDAAPDLVNSIVYGNEATSGSELCILGESVISVGYSDVSGGEGGVFLDDDSTLEWLEGNMDADPIFFGEGDYHLATDSPCIDAATDEDAPGDDFDGEERPWDHPGHPNIYSAFDMGADEYRSAGFEDDEKGAPGPGRPALMSASPNPFNPVTSIPYRVAEQGRVRLQVFDIAGRLVKTLIDEEKEAGSYVSIWDGSTGSGGRSSSGVYICRMTAGGYSESRRLVLLK